MTIQRILCLRLPNWPIQALRRRLRQSGQDQTAVALHTPVKDAPQIAPAKSTVNLDDLQFLRDIYPAARSGPAIVAVSTDAFTQGVRPGLPLAEARSLAVPVQQTRPKPSQGKRPAQAPEAAAAVLFYEWNSNQDRQELTELSDLARRFAPIVGLDEMPMPDSLLLDITGCAPLFGGEPALGRELIRDLRLSGYSGIAAFADSIAAAWAFAHWEVPQTPHRGRGSPAGLPATPVAGMAGQPDFPWLRISLPDQQLQDLQNLPLTACRMPVADLQILQHLGISSIGQLLKLPVPDLPSRLSAQAVLRTQQLHGVRPEAINPIPELSPIRSEWCAEYPAQGLRDLQWILAGLSQSISEQLIQRKRLCSTIECVFDIGEGKTVTLTSGLVRPEASAELLTDVTSLRLEFLVIRSVRDRRTSDEAGKPEEGASDFAVLENIPVHRVTMTVNSLGIPPSRQRDLFGDDERVSWTDELSTLLSRLSGRLGEENVRYITERPDPRPEMSTVSQKFPDAAQPGSSLATEKLLAALTQPDRSPSGDAQLAETSARSRVKTSRGSTAKVSQAMQRSAGQTSHGQSIEIASEFKKKPVPPTETGPPRPIRLFAEPIDISAAFHQNSAGRQFQPPAGQSTHEGLAAGTDNRSRLQRINIRALGQTWSIEHWSLPERIQTGWWTDSPCHRDYFQVTDTSGGRLWIFQDLQSSKWYLHGIFD